MHPRRKCPAPVRWDAKSTTHARAAGESVKRDQGGESSCHHPGPMETLATRQFCKRRTQGFNRAAPAVGHWGRGKPPHPESANSGGDSGHRASKARKLATFQSRARSAFALAGPTGSERWHRPGRQRSIVCSAPGLTFLAGGIELNQQHSAAISRVFVGGERVVDRLMVKFPMDLHPPAKQQTAGPAVTLAPPPHRRLQSH